MALDPVPTWIHGAKHSGDILRAATFNETGGAEGVTTPASFRVRATETPSNMVRVDPGGLLMLSPWDEGQTYSMRNASETLVEVPASSSLGANTWYINGWVNDPNKPGGTEPESTAFGPYNFLTCDSAPKGNNPAYACARIVVPEDTATIQDDMITDLRKLATPKTKPEMRTYALLSGDTTVLSNNTAYPQGATWPVAVEDAWGTIDIPSWATRARIMMMWSGVRTFDGNVFGGVWVQIGATVNPSNKKTQRVAYNSANPSDVVRDTLVASDDVYIPAALRGTSQKFYPRGNRESSGSGRLSLDGGSAMTLIVTFVEELEK